MSSLRHPHHDGSALYVSDPSPTLGETVALFVRVPAGSGVTDVSCRWIRDGTPVLAPCVVDRTTGAETWWRTELAIRRPVETYRFLLGPGHRWLTAAGVIDWDPTDQTDFRLTTFPPPPAWAGDAVVYQVFPDRFARSGAGTSAPPWASPAGWDDPVIRGGPEAMAQLYGGDLDGVREHLDHVAGLGATAIYSTPVWPARSNHRYDASSFDDVDPVLGGNEALARLSADLHDRGMRLIGDLTANHCGDAHPWFRAAMGNRDAVERGFFFIDGDGHYESWLDVASLPTFDHRSAELRRRLYDGPGSVTAAWLRPPYGLDGWRVDVANMAARHGADDLNAMLATTMRRTMARENPETYLVAEHGHDASLDLSGDGWHGVMSYAGFTHPVWRWLSDAPGRRDVQFLGERGPIPGLSGAGAASTIDAFRAAIPWRSWVHNLTLLDSHDTARWRTACGGDRDRTLAGVGLLLTFPGIPSVLYGDEVGLEGVDAEDARRPMPWDPARWDRITLERYRELIGLRRSSEALRRGGFRWAHVGDDALVFLREAPGERVLVAVSRAAHAPVELAAADLDLDGRATHLLDGEDLEADAGGVVRLPGDGPAARVWRLP
jgi:alpha-glucosidase